jgi:hypothetical protein
MRCRNPTHITESPAPNFNTTHLSAWRLRRLRQALPLNSASKRYVIVKLEFGSLSLMAFGRWSSTMRFLSIDGTARRMHSPTLSRSYSTLACSCIARRMIFAPTETWLFANGLDSKLPPVSHPLRPSEIDRLNVCNPSTTPIVEIKGRTELNFFYRSSAAFHPRIYVAKARRR